MSAGWPLVLDGVDPAFAAWAALRVAIVLVVVGVVVRGYLRRRRGQSRLLEESQRWLRGDDVDGDRTEDEDRDED
jgi:hypothetical protein